MAKAMFQFRHTGPAPTVHEVTERYGIRDEEIDEEYGVVLVDPDASLYVALVDEEARERVESALSEEDTEEGAGFYSNPPIEPFGPPERPD